MVVYLFMFISCSLCAGLVQHFYKNKKRILSTFFAILAVFIPSIIAGIRNINVGTDIKVYGIYMFNIARSHSIIGYFGIVGTGDILYSFLNILTSLLSDNIHVLLFIIQFINCSIVFIAIFKERENIHMSLSYFIFLSTLYFRQLNLLRQGLALSFVLLAFVLFKNKKIKSTIFCMIIASLFHATAILAIPLFVIYKYVKDDNKNDNYSESYKYFLVAIYISLILVFVFFKPLFNIILNSGILPSKYTLEYFERYFNSVIELDNLGTFFKLAWCVIYLLAIKYIKKANEIKDYRFFLHIASIDFILWNFNIYVKYIDRISFYYGYIYALFFVPNLYKLFKNDFLNRNIANLIVIVMFFAYWYLRFVFQNAGNVYPYIIGI